MRKIIVNEREYRYWIRNTGKYERTIYIRSAGIGYAWFVTEGNITPRMIREYILWNPTLDNNKRITPDIDRKLYEAFIDSLLHVSGII